MSESESGAVEKKFGPLVVKSLREFPGRLQKFINPDRLEGESNYQEAVNEAIEAISLLEIDHLDFSKLEDYQYHLKGKSLAMAMLVLAYADMYNQLITGRNSKALAQETQRFYKTRYENLMTYLINHHQVRDFVNYPEIRVWIDPRLSQPHVRNAHISSTPPGPE